MCKNMEIQKKSQILIKGFGFIVYINYVKYTSILQYIQMMLNTCLKLNLHYTHSTSFLILRNTWSFILFYNFMGNDRVKILGMYYNLYMQKSLKQHFFFSFPQNLDHESSLSLCLFATSFASNSVAPKYTFYWKSRLEVDRKIQPFFISGVSTSQSTLDTLEPLKELKF